jgi:hypothetical protein
MVGRLLVVVAAVLALLRPSDAAQFKSVEVDGTAFKVTLTDGRVLHSPDLVGATLAIATNNSIMRVRIDAVERDPDAVNGPVWLHTFSTQTRSGTWENPCVPGPDGRRQGFPLGGRPSADGTMEPAPNVFELVCTAGGRGKCVRFGYQPWANDGLRGMFNACVRLLRADYCGNGVGTTRNGTLVNIYDDLGIQKAEDVPNLEFEAGWGANGAVCVRHVRIKDNISPQALVAACPRLKNLVGAVCTEAKARALGGQIFNQSKP